MKVRTYLYGLFVIMLLLGCTSSRNTGDSDNKAEYSDGSNVKVSLLLDYLRGIPRLSVRGNQVYNSSASSFQNDTRVLFVVDGIQFGRDFSQVASAFTNENQTVSVQFFKMSRATQRYGEAGRNGVIVIKTNQS